MARKARTSFLVVGSLDLLLILILKAAQFVRYSNAVACCVHIFINVVLYYCVTIDRKGKLPPLFPVSETRVFFYTL